MTKAAALWKQGKKGEATAHYLASNIPMLGPFAAQIGEALGRHDVGGPLTMVAGAELGGRVTEGLGKVGKTALRYESGAGQAALDNAVEETATKNAEKLAEHDKAVEAIGDQNRTSLAASRDAERQATAGIEHQNDVIRAKHQDAVTKVRAANADAQAAVKSGQDAEVVASKPGPNAVAQSLPAIADSETAAAKAAYPKIEGSAPKADVYAELQTIVDDEISSSKGSERHPTITLAHPQRYQARGRRGGIWEVHRTLSWWAPLQLK